MHFVYAHALPIRLGTLNPFPNNLYLFIIEIPHAKFVLFVSLIDFWNRNENSMSFISRTLNWGKVYLHLRNKSHIYAINRSHFCTKQIVALICVCPLPNVDVSLLSHHTHMHPISFTPQNLFSAINFMNNISILTTHLAFPPIAHGPKREIFHIWFGKNQ